MNIPISMDLDQWRTVLDALNDKYPDSDCVDLITATLTDLQEDK